MLLRPKAQFWKPEDDNSKENIIQGFAELYSAVRQPVPNVMKAVKHLINICSTNYDDALKAFQPLKKPKSSARDFYGFSQQEIIAAIAGANLSESFNKMATLIHGVIKDPENTRLFLHTTSKMMLKKKTPNPTTYDQLRPLSIMPAWVMCIDKLLYPYIKEKMKGIISTTQYGNPEGADITMAKEVIMYNAVKRRSRLLERFY